MRAVLPGRPPAKLQALSTAQWEDLRVVVYISGHAVVILGSAQELLQTIYIDEVESLEAVTVEETSGRIAVCGGHYIYVYKPYGKKDGLLRWSQAQRVSASDGQEGVTTLSWASPEELLAGNSSLTLWYLTENPVAIWTQKLANPVKFAQVSYDGSLIASSGHYERLVKIWRRESYGSEGVRFDSSYLPHPATVTNMHWRRPWHQEQNLDNVLYTICADNKVRIWAATDPHGLAALQLWAEIDMYESIQPRKALTASQTDRRYGFIVDSRDFSIATERAVQRGTGQARENHALEHLIEIATRSPEICVVLDGRGHMSAWGLENVGSKTRMPSDVFNIVHVEGANIAFGRESNSEEDYAQFVTFSGGASPDSFTILVHYFDGRINWFDSKIDTLFDPSSREKRLTFKASWTGHDGPVKKIVRNVSGKTQVSRTSENRGVIWKQRPSEYGPVLTRQSALLSDEHIHRTCVIGDGEYLVNLHHHSISLWDTRFSRARQLGSCDYKLSGKPLCLLLLPSTDVQHNTIYVATIGSDMKGVAWEIVLPIKRSDHVNGNVDKRHVSIRQFCVFDLGMSEDLSFVLPVDPAGSETSISGFLDVFALDVALSYTATGTMMMWTAKVEPEKRKVDWLRTANVMTGIKNPSLASGSSIRKAALIDEDKTGLTIWDTSASQLEHEETFTTQDVIQDLDWTSTPDIQSILAVGFPHRILLLSQLRYDYLNAGPAWAGIREIRIRDLTPHPIGDSCWLGNGNLVVGAGNQLFVYDRTIEVNDKLINDLNLSSKRMPSMDLFNLVRRLNGPLPIYHPQFLGQSILSGRISMVHEILIRLHKKLKFFVDGDEIDIFLDMPLEDFLNEPEAFSGERMKELHSSYADISDDMEPLAVDEDIAAILNENLTKVVLPHLSSQEQFHLADIIECVATVEKHRRSMDDNAARYLLFFRQHMLRKGQAPSERLSISWREIVWAFHSGSQDILVDLVSRQFHGKMLWQHARESGIFMWLTDLNALRAQLEVIARNEYTKSDEKNPVDCSLYYLALKKKSVLQGLWRMASWNREQAATQRLLANNFQEHRWKTAALKNAYTLLSKRRFEYAAAFFLLAGNVRDAAYVCVNQLHDYQLAVTLTRAYEGDNGPVLHELIEEKILPEAAEQGNRWLATWAFWMLNRRDRAVRALISPISALLPSSSPSSPGSPGASIPLQAKSYLSNDPALVVLYKQLREKTLQALKGAARVPPRDEWDFIIRNARLYTRMGCDLLALELVRNWEFLRAAPPPFQRILNRRSIEEANDPRRLLRRRSSLVVDDSISPANILAGWGGESFASPTTPTTPRAMSQQPVKAVAAHQAKKPPPTVFEEPDANGLLDNFGF